MNIVPFKGSALTTGDLSSRLQEFKQTAPRTSDGSLYIKMGKDGAWSYGAEENEPEQDSKWAINPHSLEQGYICWSTGEDNSGPLDEIMYTMGQDKPPVSEMTKIEEGRWVDQLSVAMQCVSGEDKGLDVVYKTNSKSGVSEINALVDRILKQQEIDAEKIVPIVHLENDHYKHKKYGKIYTPVLEIAEWCSMDAAPADEVEEEEDKPVRRRRRKK